MFHWQRLYDGKTYVLDAVVIVNLGSWPCGEFHVDSLANCCWHAQMVDGNVCLNLSSTMTMCNNQKLPGISKMHHFLENPPFQKKCNILKKWGNTQSLLKVNTVDLKGILRMPRKTVPGTCDDTLLLVLSCPMYIHSWIWANLKPWNCGMNFG